MIFNNKDKHNENLDIYTSSQMYNIDHKIVRSFLHAHNLKCKIKTNTSRKRSFIEPTDDLLFSSLSIIAHNLYLCEGWHTNKTNKLYFCNQDIHVIKIFCQCLITTYQYKTKIAIFLVYNFNDINSKKIVNHMLEHFSNSNIYNLSHVNDTSRKNPIIRVQAGGKNLSYLFIENAYKIFHSE